MDPEGPSLGLSPYHPRKGPEIPNSRLAGPLEIGHLRNQAPPGAIRPRRGTHLSPSLKYHRRLACVPFPTKGDDRKPEDGPCPQRRWQISSRRFRKHRRDAYDTFAWRQARAVQKGLSRAPKGQQQQAWANTSVSSVSSVRDLFVFFVGENQGGSLGGSSVARARRAPPGSDGASPYRPWSWSSALRCPGLHRNNSLIHNK